MPSKTRQNPALIGLLLTTCLHLTFPTAGRTQGESAEDERRAVAHNDRYLDRLKQRPREGTAFDRVYAFHVDRGSLQQYVDSLGQQATTDGVASLLQGMIELRRGHDAAARTALERAEKLRSTDPIPSWYLGQVLVAIGESDRAAEALERAITRNPERAELAEIYQLLGRIYQRGHKNEQALSVWKRFEATFPDDERVQEQIATILVEEQQLKEALGRLETLSQKASDPLRRLQFGIDAAELKLRLGRKGEAVTDLENVINQLKPGSWLLGDVRDTIEETFLHTDDYSGLTRYYETWINKHPDDLNAMTRLGRNLSAQGQTENALQWYRRAVSKAPSDTKLRKALIGQLVRDKRYADAINEYEELAEFDRGNSDRIERWGMLYLKRDDLPRTERQSKAAEIWKTMLQHRPDDAVVVSRVADLFRGASMADEAIKLYQRAVDLEPTNPQFREYLGEYFHALKRPDDARRMWEEMIAGDLRTTENLVRLSEVYRGFDYTEDALRTMAAACEIDPEFSDRIRFSQMLRDARLVDNSLTQLDLARRLAETPEQRQTVLDERIKTLLEGGLLAEKTSQMASALDTTSGSADQWRVLTLYQEAMGLLPEASLSIQKATLLDSDSVAVCTTAGRILEKSGMLAAASAAHSKLAVLDRRFQTEHLKKIAELEKRLGRTETALQAGKEFITAAAGNAENFQFFADLCFQLGKPDEGLDALRRSVRLNPSDVASLTALAKALAGQFKTPEAIELNWRAFDKSNSLDARIAIVQPLTELYLRTNHFDQLIARLQNFGRKTDQQRDMTICLANAYQAAGDIGMAREVLKKLLIEESRDVVILDELGKLSEQEGDYQSAADYQKLMLQIVPSDDGTVRLANLLVRLGKVEAADDLWASLSQTDTEPHRLIKSIDNLITAGNPNTARRICRQMLQRNKRDWEVLLRLAILDWKEARHADAVANCDQLLALDFASDTPSYEQRHTRSRRSMLPVGTATGDQYSARHSSTSAAPELIQDATRLQALAQSLNLSASRARSTFSRTSLSWSADTFADARHFVLLIRSAAAVRENRRDRFFSALRQNAESVISTDARPAWDWYFAAASLQTMGGPFAAEMQAATSLLAQRPEPEAKLAYLHALQKRRAANTPTASASPLNDSQMELMLTAWQIVRDTRREWVDSGLVTTVITELEAAGREGAASEVFAQLIREDAGRIELIAALQVALTRNNIEQFLTLVNRVVKSGDLRTSPAGQNVVANQIGTMFAQIASTMVAQENPEAVKDLLVRFLDLKAETHADAPPAPTRNPPVTSYVTVARVPIFSAGQQANYQQINMLATGNYWTGTDTAFLVNLHHFIKNGDAPGLLDNLSAFRDARSGLAAVYAELVLAQFRFLQNSLEQSAVHLVRAAELAPGDTSLRMCIVRLHQKLSNDADALALLDTIDTVDQNLLQQRELLALQLAAKTGNVDRAKQAAERLFGLQLDSKAQIALSTHLKNFGMHKMSDALLSRTRHSTGNDMSTLTDLMTRYNDEANADVANQIAHQILRQSANMAPSRTTTSVRKAREAAVIVLNESGQLQQLIQRVQDQLVRSPQSVRLHQTLSEYYKAAGRTADAARVDEQLKAMAPQNIDTLIKLAQQLERSRKYTEASEKYLEVLHRDVQRFTQNYYQYLRTFQQAGKLPQLADVLLASDIRKLNNNYFVVNETLEYLFRESTRGRGAIEREKGLELFAAAWKAFPNNRTFMLSNIRDQSIWELPVMFDYVREGMVPGTVQQATAKPWQGIADALVYNSSGTVTASFTRLSKALQDDEKLQTFSDEVESAVNKFDAWYGGQLILCALKAKTGQFDDATEILERLNADTNVSFVPPLVAWVIGGELHQLDKRYRPHVISMMQRALQHDSANAATSYVTSPSYFVAKLLAEEGRTAEARQAVHDALASVKHPVATGSNAGVEQYRNAQDYVAAGETLLQFTLPFDALKMFQKVTPKLVAGSGRYKANVGRLLKQAKAGIAKSRSSMTPDSVLTYLQHHSAADTTSLRPPLDLMLVPPTEGIEQAAIRSVFVEVLLKIKTTSPIQTAQTVRLLESMIEKSAANDPTASIMGAAFGNSTHNEALLQTSITKLREYVAYTRAQSRMNPTEVPTVDQIALWIPARIALNSAEDFATGQHLADLAELAARSHRQHPWLLAILKERGDVALAQRDKPAAEKAWSSMLDTILADASDQRAPSPTRAATTTPASTDTGTSALEELRERLLNKTSDPQTAP
jgi:tetratricopeptide (TPR) repeat protein